jgi:hypothetical protein
MFKQLREWMLYGNLSDEHDEFFVCLSSSSSSSAAAAVSGRQAPTAADKGGAGGGDLDEIFSVSSSRFSSSFTHYSLNPVQLPGFIGIKTANKIIFTGELLQLFKSKSLDDIYTNYTGVTENDASMSNYFQYSMNFSINRVQHITDSNKCNGEINIIVIFCFIARILIIVCSPSFFFIIKINEKHSTKSSIS